MTNYQSNNGVQGMIKVHFTKLFIFSILFPVLFATVKTMAEDSFERGLQRVSAQETKIFKQEDRVAIIVGIDQYNPKSGFRPLKYAVADAKALAELFKEQGYIVKLLLNDEAKRGFILDAIVSASDLLISPEGKQGTLVFVFTGHGFADSNNINYLGVDGTTATRLSSTGLSLNEVKKEILKSGARRSMMFIDACRDNPIKAKTGNNPGFKDLRESEGLNILYSTGQGRFSYEAPALEHGIFSYFLLQGLQGKAAQKDGLILFGDLANYVSKEVKRWSFTNLSKTQKPFRAGESSGQFLVGALKQNFISSWMDGLKQHFISNKKDQDIVEVKLKLPPLSLHTSMSLPEENKKPEKQQLQTVQLINVNLGTKNANRETQGRNNNFKQNTLIKVAKQKTPVEQYNLGERYYYGFNNEKKSYKQAIKWYRKSAEQGNEYGQRNLGICYEYGTGVQINYPKALHWYKKAKKNGYKKIDKDIRRVLKK